MIQHILFILSFMIFFFSFSFCHAIIFSVFLGFKYRCFKQFYSLDNGLKKKTVL